VLRLIAAAVLVVRVLSMSIEQRHRICRDEKHNNGLVTLINGLDDKRCTNRVSVDVMLVDVSTSTVSVNVRCH
jgi:hypothetical protein